MKKGILIAIACLLAAFIGLGVYSMSGDNICKNVYVEDVNIGGLTKAEAKEKLEKEYDMKEITFKYQDKTWNLKPEAVEMSYDIDKTIDNAFNVNRDKNIVSNMFNSICSTLGVKKHISVAVDFNKDKVKEELETISEEINVEVQDATLEINGESINVVKEKAGQTLEIDKTIKKLVDTIQNGNFEEELVVTKVEPEVIAEDLEGIDCVLGSFSTSLAGSSANRIENVRLAAESNNNIIIMPGENHSYNEHTGVRSVANGYKNAPVIQGGEVADGIGGGVCQVSSTMFNTVLYAGLDIVSRANHSIPSSYVGLGRDATVTNGGADFIFKNNLKNPVFLKTYYAGGRVYCSIFGHKSDKQKIEIATVVNSVTQNKVIEREDPNIEEGKREVTTKGRVGRNVSTYRIFYDKNGKQVKRELVCTSNYPSKTEEVSIGTKKKETTEPGTGEQTPGTGGTTTPDPGTGTTTPEPQAN